MAFNKDWFLQNRSSIIDDEVQEQLKDGAKWPIFVYDWINKTPNTEAGLRPANEPRNRHYQWTEIIKGNESIYLSPMNATILTKHQGTGKVDENNQVDGSYYDVKYSKDNGVVFYGLKSNNGGGDDFTSTDFGGFGDFTTISDSETIEMKTLQKVSKDMLTKFFYIPDVAQIMQNNNAGVYDQEFNDNDIFYISSYTNHFDPKTQDFVYSEITFSNLQQNMAQSGQVVEQHVYLASPGAGYLVPKLIFDKNGTPIGGEDGWEWNTAYTQDLGVKTIQIESTGNAAIQSLEIWGQPVDKNHNDINDKRWYAPRKLLVQKFQVPLEENFTKVSPNDDVFDLIDGQFEATADLQSYKTMLKDYIGDKALDFQAILASTKDSVAAANSTGKRINDINFGYTDDFVNKSLKVGDPSNSNDDLTRINVRPSSWFYGYGESVNTNLGQQTIDLRNIHKTPDGKEHSIKDLFNIMSFASNYINRLPLEINTKMTWSTADFPGFGGWVSTLLLGMNPQWRTETSNTDKVMPNLQTLPYLVSHNLYTLATSSAYESSAVNKNNTTFAWDINNLSKGFKDAGKMSKIPGYFFQRAESDALGSVLSNKSNSTALTFRLTDKIYGAEYNNKTGEDMNKLTPISTVMLDQLNGDARYKVKDTSFSINADSTSDGTDGKEEGQVLNTITDVNGDSYIITNIGIRAIGDGDIRITCFNRDIDDIKGDDDYHNYICFQTYMHSTANYKNGQIREWMTNINTSYMDFLDKYLNNKFNWPQALQQPKPNEYYPDINITKHNISDYWNYPIFDLSKSSSGTASVRYNQNKLNGLDFILHDFKVDGFNNVNEIKKDYGYINISTDKLNFNVSKWAGTQFLTTQSGEWLSWVRQMDVYSNNSDEGTSVLYNNISLNEKISLNNITSDISNTYKYISTIKGLGDMSDYISDGTHNADLDSVDLVVALYFKNDTELHINISFNPKGNIAGTRIWSRQKDPFGGYTKGSYANAIVFYLGTANISDVSNGIKDNFINNHDEYVQNISENNAGLWSISATVSQD